MPIGTTEDRLVGSIDLAVALTGGEVRFSPNPRPRPTGACSTWTRNLLPDHLVDVLLDVAVSGVNRVEREGISPTRRPRSPAPGRTRPWHYGWWWMMMPVTVVLWAAVVWVVASLVHERRPRTDDAGGAERILAERYARGEIDADDYRGHLEDLRR